MTFRPFRLDICHIETLILRSRYMYQIRQQAGHQPTRQLVLCKGSCNNLDADFGSWILDPGFCIIALHRLDSTSPARDGLVVIIVTGYLRN
jgi:hypothetical protein